MELLDLAIFLLVAVLYVHINAHVRSPDDRGVVDARGLPAHELGDLFAGNQPAVHTWPHAIRESSPLALTKRPQTVPKSVDLRATKAYRTFVPGPALVSLAPYSGVPDNTARFDAADVRYYADASALSDNFHKVMLEKEECLYIPPQWWYGTEAPSLELHSIISHVALIPAYFEHLLYRYGRRVAPTPVVLDTKLKSSASADEHKQDSNERVQPSDPRLPKGAVDAAVE